MSASCTSAAAGRLANVDKDRNMQLLPHAEWRKGWNGEDMSVVKKRPGIVTCHIEVGGLDEFS